MGKRALYIPRCLPDGDVDVDYGQCLMTFLYCPRVIELGIGSWCSIMSGIANSFINWRISGKSKPERGFIVSLFKYWYFRSLIINNVHSSGRLLRDGPIATRQPFGDPCLPVPFFVACLRKCRWPRPLPPRCLESLFWGSKGISNLVIHFVSQCFRLFGINEMWWLAGDVQQNLYACGQLSLVPFSNDCFTKMFVLLVFLVVKLLVGIVTGSAVTPLKHFWISRSTKRRRWSEP